MLSNGPGTPLRLIPESNEQGGAGKHSGDGKFPPETPAASCGPGIKYRALRI